MTDTIKEEMAAKEIEEISPRIQVINFAVELPPIALQRLDEPSPQLPAPTDNIGVVGTITLLNQSAIIWFGWGGMVRDESSSTGRGVPTLGQVVVAMPRTKYKGAFSDSHDSSCSQLIGGSEEDQLICENMAARLSQKLGFPIVVCGGLASQTDQTESLLAGVDSATAAQRAAALTEREVAHILKERHCFQI